jgi:hypothetical protein
MAYEAFYYAHESNNTEVVALAGEDQLSIRTAMQRGNGPKALLDIGYAFLKGLGVQVQVGNSARGVAEGSEIVVHSIVNGQGNIIKWRYILLESSQNGSVKDLNNQVIRSVPPGYYCDINVDANGAITSTTTPAVFDPNDPPADSADVMEAVNDARASEGV